MEGIDSIDEISKISVSLRVPYLIHRQILIETTHPEVLKNKKSKSLNATMTDGYLAIIRDGLELKKMQRLAADPERLREFKEKYDMLFKDETRDEALERMDVDELSALISLATQKKTVKFKQLILEAGSG